MATAQRYPIHGGLAKDSRREDHAAVTAGNCGRWGSEGRYHYAGRSLGNLEAERARGATIPGRGHLPSAALALFKLNFALA
jgi:hypothetical protein